MNISYDYAMCIFTYMGTYVILRSWRTISMEEKKKTSEAQKRATRKYISGLYEVKVRLPKSYQKTVKLAADIEGRSINEYLMKLIDIDIEEKFNAGSITEEDLEGEDENAYE